ncbi:MULTISPECIES: fimbrial biogenesis chaperone [Vibrio harveyi group]|uniref:fimbrial biogenesis chaperone n=1 Tax=Vibrio harveyi group TaxID=717610 RepID=UPI0003A7779E|nr:MULTISPECIES: fimbria/pilus periplasmic chaperone [Vibrio harveyi group]PAW11877.1 fimbrial chaperone protein [Vibrio sp. V1B]
MFLRFFVVFITLIFGFAAHANIVMTGSRIIYPEGEPFVNVYLKNKSKNVFMVQSWFENEDGSKATQNDVPFVVLPPLAKIEPQRGQTLRIIKGIEKTLPQDQESVFYFNFLQIPSNAAIAEVAASSNKIVVTVKHKVKLFYRPKKVINYNRNWKKDFQVQLINYQNGIAKVRLINKQPLHVSLSGNVFIEHLGEKWLSEAKMILPNSYQDFTFKNLKIKKGDKADFLITTISDQGALIPKRYSIQF